MQEKHIQFPDMAEGNSSRFNFLEVGDRHGILKQILLSNLT